jgi:predicted aspartyl protease
LRCRAETAELCRGANGTIKARRVPLESVPIGPIEIKAVAAVAESEKVAFDEPLLRISVLQKFGPMTLTREEALAHCDVMRVHLGEAV